MTRIKSGFIMCHWCYDLKYSGVNNSNNNSNSKYMNDTHKESRHRYRVRGNRHTAPPGSGETSAKSGWIVPTAATQMRSPGGKLECGNDVVVGGGVIIRSDKHDG